MGLVCCVCMCIGDGLVRLLGLNCVACWLFVIWFVSCFLGLFVVIGSLLAM